MFALKLTTVTLMRTNSLTPRYVEYLPEKLESGVLYISLEYNTVAHLCVCGCSEEVVTPLSPVDWQLWGSRDIVTLYPSIGNWNLKCRSHYWIRNNRVVWSYDMTKQEVARIQRRERILKQNYVNSLKSQKTARKGNSHNHKPSTVGSFAKWLYQKIKTVLRWLNS